jgi:hypothetical protein
MPGLTNVTAGNKLAGMGGFSKPRTRQAGATSTGVKPYGMSTSGSPDVLGTLRRARSVLAGEPTAIRLKTAKLPKAV